MVLTMDGSKNSASEDDEDDDHYKEESMESLINILKQQKVKLVEKELMIEDLKADLRREKKLNDMLIDQAAYVRSLRHQVDMSLKGQPVKSGNHKDGDDVNEDSMLPSQPITPYQKPSGVPLSSEDKTEENPTGIGREDIDGDDDSEDDGDDDKKEDLASIHERCAKPAEKFGYVLNALKNLPHNRTTLFIADSNFHCIKGELDPVNRCTAVRAVSGLCIVGAAQTLKNYGYQYPNVKKVVFSLGVNDHLHKKQHCPDDFTSHFSTLIEESKRVFCSATLHFILPFKGLPRVPLYHIQKIAELLKTNFPLVKRHEAPTMKGKVSVKDGIHINGEGAESLRAFLVSRFTSYKPPQVNHPQPVDDSRRRVSHPMDIQPESVLGQRSRPPATQPNMSYRAWGQPEADTDGPYHRAWGPPERDNIQYPPLRDDGQRVSNSYRMDTYQHRDSLKDLSEALASVMYKHMCSGRP